MVQLAIANKNGQVELWCRDLGTTSTGAIKFEVINGWWQGFILGDLVHVIETGHEFSGNSIIWRGTAPFGMGQYNEAIQWIQERSTTPTGRIRDYIFVGGRDIVEEELKEDEDWDDDIPF